MDITSIYTNGATLVPTQTKNGEWVWMVAEFEDDSFVDGDIIDPLPVADTLDELLDYYD